MPEGGDFLNLIRAQDVDEFVYVDFCHLPPNGKRPMKTPITIASGRARAASFNWFVLRVGC
jgi:hypothetical protein